MDSGPAPCGASRNDRVSCDGSPPLPHLKSRPRHIGCRIMAQITASEATMKIDDVRLNAYSMPLTNPSFPPGPYRFFNREYFIITYKTDPEALAAVVPEPLEVAEPLVKYEFIRMPDSIGFGDYTE